MTEPTERHVKRQKCKREIPRDGIYYKHPEFGIVCEYCPEFKDGGVQILNTEE